MPGAARLLVCSLHCIVVLFQLPSTAAIRSLFFDADAPPAAPLEFAERRSQLRAADAEKRSLDMPTDFSLLNLRPAHKCPVWTYGADSPGYYCPSPSAADAREWQCIRAADLCNGIVDCDGKEDENPTLCLFHLATRDLMLRVQGMVSTHFVDDHNAELKPLSGWDKRSL